jgi:hypothetical protein
VLTGGPGSNRYAAGPGNDRILSRNGSREMIDCGGGTDTVVADVRDRLRSCERRRTA